MPLTDHTITGRDRFDPEEHGPFSFPCCACIHRWRRPTDPPCSKCDHNIEAEPAEDEASDD